MSSMCSSWRRTSPSSAAASSGSKLAISIVFLNICQCLDLAGAACVNCTLLQQILDDGAPGLREISAVIAAATHREQAPVAEALGKLAKLAGGAPV